MPVFWIINSENTCDSLNFMPDSHRTEVLPVKKQDFMKLLSAKEVRSLGLPTNVIGCGYLKTAVILTFADSNMVWNMMSRLYPSVAEMHGTTPSRVERAMRHAVGIAWDRGNSVMHAAFRKKPRNFEIIAYIVDDICRRLSEFGDY